MSAFAEVEAGGEVVDVAVEAYRIVGAASVGFLKEIWRFGMGALREVLLEESVALRGGGEAVEYALDARIVGCIRQPIAAVRRVGAVYSILGGCVVVLLHLCWSLRWSGLELEVESLMQELLDSGSRAWRLPTNQIA